MLRKDGARSSLFLISELFYVLFVSIVMFCVLFVCKCVLYYCHPIAVKYIIYIILLRSNVLLCIVSFENTGKLNTSYTCGALHIAV